MLDEALEMAGVPGTGSLSTCAECYQRAEKGLVLAIRQEGALNVAVCGCTSPLVATRVIAKCLQPFEAQ